MAKKIQPVVPGVRITKIELTDDQIVAASLLFQADINLNAESGTVLSATYKRKFYESQEALQFLIAPYAQRITAERQALEKK